MTLAQALLLATDKDGGGLIQASGINDIVDSSDDRKDVGIDNAGVFRNDDNQGRSDGTNGSIAQFHVAVETHLNTILLDFRLGVRSLLRPNGHDFREVNTSGDFTTFGTGHCIAVPEREAQGTYG